MSASGEEPDDRALLAAHVAGDPDAFGALVRRHRDRLWAVALRTLGDREEAADALQDALVSAFRSAGTYRGDAAVTTWLHRVVVNACLDRVRRRAARPADPLPDSADTVLADRRDDHLRAEQRLDLAAALARVPEAQRVAVLLVDAHGLPVAEAAEVLGVPEGTVKSRCARGRAALALLLRPPAEDGPDGGRGPERSERSEGSEGNRPARRRVAPEGGGAGHGVDGVAGGVRAPGGRQV